MRISDWSSDVCSSDLMLDGFDTQVLAFVVPNIAASWHLTPASFGPILATSLAGIMLGQFVLGSLSDRLGRRKTMMISVAIFGAFTIAKIGRASCREGVCQYV